MTVWKQLDFSSGSLGQCGKPQRGVRVWKVGCNEPHGKSNFSEERFRVHLRNVSHISVEKY